MVRVALLLEQTRDAMGVIEHVLDKVAERDLSPDQVAAMAEIVEELLVLSRFAGCVLSSKTAT